MEYTLQNKACRHVPVINSETEFVNYNIPIANDKMSNKMFIDMAEDILDTCKSIIDKIDTVTVSISHFKVMVTRWATQDGKYNNYVLPIDLNHIDDTAVTHMSNIIRQLMKTVAVDLMTLSMPCHDIIVKNFTVKIVTITENGEIKHEVIIYCKDCISL